MVGYEYSEVCPICGYEDMMVDVDNTFYKFVVSFGNCEICGFYYRPKMQQMSLEAVNQFTDEYNEYNVEIKSGEMEERKKITPEEYDKWKRKFTEIFGDN